ncbi:MAG: hypothetical protein H6Q70_3623 [Firmicutes bacterium]|nr:hypothetical protein [Bacillota bacterium]
MSKKNLMINSGVPLFVNYKEDLPAKTKATADSWYVICNFESDGKQVGFEWHQMFMGSGTIQVNNTEFLLMEGTEKVWIDNAKTGPTSEIHGASDKELNVYSEFGSLRGDYRKMTLKLEVENGSVDVVLTPRENNVLYNGTTGLLNLLNTDSYQFSFPNMDVDGTVTIRGKEYKVNHATAWFDRQWGFGSAEGLLAKSSDKSLKPAWMWLGMTLNDDACGAISLWDTYSGGKKNAFATILNKNGTQINVTADITYDHIWTSSRTGNQYPANIHISIPAEKLDITLTALLDEPEFAHNGGMTQGCQSLCAVTGSYKGCPINRHVILEMIGDLCGE